MPGTLSVWLNSVRVGDLTNISGDYTIFAFDDAYRADPARPILSQSLVNAIGEPLRIIPRTHALAPPYFSNLLPENDSLLRSLLARQHHINVTPDFEFLRALGDDLPGAVRILDEGAIPELSDNHEPIAHRAEMPLRFSLAGAQLKFSGSMKGDRLTIPSKGGTWIVKLPTNTYARLPQNEFSMMRFASAIGLNVPSTHLLKLSDVDNLPAGLPALRSSEPEMAYVVERFDRLPHAMRLHFEDINQVAGQFPHDKYDNKATEYVARVVAELCPARDLEELITRIVFGIAIANNDMHLKNWAITYPQGDQPRIAPLYDFVCTKLYFSESNLNVSIGGEKAYSKLARETLTRFAERAELSSRQVWKSAKEAVERIRDTWTTFKQTIPESDLVSVLDRHMDEVPLLKLR